MEWIVPTTMNNVLETDKNTMKPLMIKKIIIINTNVVVITFWFDFHFGFKDNFINWDL